MTQQEINISYCEGAPPKPYDPSRWFDLINTLKERGGHAELGPVSSPYLSLTKGNIRAGGAKLGMRVTINAKAGCPGYFTVALNGEIEMEESK